MPSQAEPERGHSKSKPVTPKLDLSKSVFSGGGGGDKNDDGKSIKRRDSKHDKTVVKKKASKEEDFSSDDDSDEAISNEARRAGFAALKKQGEDVRRSLAAKMFMDGGDKFDRLMRRLNEGDDEGYGLIDKESFTNIMHIQLRSKHRPTDREIGWLCDKLRTKNGLIAYREMRSVIMGDYFDGSSYMPMWATAAMPLTPATYYMPSGTGPNPSPYLGQSLPFTMSSSFNPYSTSSAAAYMTRRMSFDQGRNVPHAEVMQPSPMRTRTRKGSGKRRPSSSEYYHATTMGMSIPLSFEGLGRGEDQEVPMLRRKGSDGTSRRPFHDGKDKKGRRRQEEESQAWNEIRQQHHHHHRNGRGYREAKDTPEEGKEEKGSWPRDDEESDGDDWAYCPGTVGEWLKYVASPLERKNFEEFLQMLEEYEYDRGLTHRRLDDPLLQEGVVVKLGGMLGAKITFFVSDEHA